MRRIHTVQPLFKTAIFLATIVFCAALGQAQGPIAPIEDTLDTLAHEIDEGAWDEAGEYLEKLEKLLNSNRSALVESAGEVAEEELAEIGEFVARLDKSIEAEDGTAAVSVIRLIKHEIEEIEGAMVAQGYEAPDAIDALAAKLGKISDEASEGEWDEAREFIEAFAGQLAGTRAELVQAGGAAAAEELAVIRAFVKRLEEAVESQDLTAVTQVLDLIHHELEEIEETVADAPAGAKVELEHDGRIASGGRLEVEVLVEHLSAKLGAFSITLTFDPKVVRADQVDVLYGAGVKRIDNEAGRVMLQGFKAQDASAGRVEIGGVTFAAIGNPGDDAGIEVIVDELVDADGAPVTIDEIEAGSVIIAQ